MEVRAWRKGLGVVPAFKRVDTCAAEFEAKTPYMYSSYDGSDECDSTNDRKVCPTLMHKNGVCIVAQEVQVGCLLQSCHAGQSLQVLILGGGPNRIGQGIEFDYCCCHASFALRCVLNSSDPKPCQHVRTAKRGVLAF